MESERARTVTQLDGSYWPFPWAGVFELAEAVPCRHWSLIGGLMVQLHCFANNVEPTRPTADIDTLAHVEIENRGSLSILKNGLRELGYREASSIDSRAPLHRYRRGDESRLEQVDFLIADHVAPRILRDLPVPTPVRAPGGTNALRRTQEFEIVYSSGSAKISTPDIIGALVLKIEAYAADSRDRERHLKDAVILAILVDEHNWGSPLHGDAPHRMRKLIAWLEDADRTEAAGITDDDISDAIIALQDLLEAQTREA